MPDGVGVADAAAECGHGLAGKLGGATDRRGFGSGVGHTVNAGVSDGKIHGRTPLVGDGHVGQGIEPAGLKLTADE
jgi:hypothetical protein